MLNLLRPESKKAGLLINIKKISTNQSLNVVSIALEKASIEKINLFWTTDFCNGLQNNKNKQKNSYSQKSFCAEISSQQHISKICILLVRTFDCQTSSLTKIQAYKIRICENNIERIE